MRRRKMRKRRTMKKRMGKANTGPEVTCPPSQHQDLRVEYGEGGPIAQVNWMHNLWITANSNPPFSPLERDP